MQKRKIIAGDPLKWTVPASDFDGWTANLRLIPKSTTDTVVTITGTVQNGVATFSQDSTSSFSTKGYTYSIYFVNSTKSITVEQGDLTVLPDPRTAAAGFDPRSELKQELDTALDLLKNWDSMGKYHKYKIGDREVEYGTQSELMSRIRFLRAMVAKEEGISIKRPFSVLVGTRGSYENL